MLEHLNDQQRRAVEYIESPLLVVAGPGTGKTRILTEKVLFLVNDKGYDPSKILVTTFTIKAADEIRERIRKKLGESAENIQISTIHSFCYKMLELFPEYYNFGVGFKVVDELDQFIIVNKNYKWAYKLDEFHDEIDVETLINFYNRATSNNLNPKELIRYLKKHNASKKELAIARSYELYLKDLKNFDEPKLDFAMIQSEFLKMLKRHSEVLNKVRDMYDYIIVDEYQDTSPIQDAIIHLISKPKYKITVVGDEDQSIYGFRGASLQNFRSFLERYPGARKMELEQNYRSTPEIVDCFETFMRQYRIFEKNIFTNNAPFSKPILLLSKDYEQEAVSIKNTIINLVQNNNINYGDIAILFKSVKYHAPRIIEELERANIPYVSIGDSSLLSRDEIRDLILLQLYINSFRPKERHLTKYYDRDLLYSDWLDLEQDTIEKLRGDYDKKDFISSYTYKKLKQLDIVQKDIDVLIGLQNLQKEQMRAPSSQLILFYKILDVTGYGYRLFRRLEEEPESNVELIIRNLAKYSIIIDKFERNTNSRDIGSFIFHLDSIPEYKLEDSASFEGIDAVKLMTIHQAKGLEFPVVILGGVSKNRYNRNQSEKTSLIKIPSELLLDKYEYNRLEELRRVFYVGMSRAKKLLIISTFNNQTRIKQSTFIDDIGGRNKFIEASEFLKRFTDKDHYVEIFEKRRLSYSSISSYMSCPFHFYCRDILKFSTPIPMFQLYGIIVHNCLQNIHELIKEGKTLKITEIIKIVDKYCKNEECQKNWRDSLITELYEYYLRTPGFIKEVLEVEYPFSYISGDVIINGKADLIIKNPDDEIEIIDFKTRYKQGLEKMSVDTQLRIYNIALEHIFKEPIKKISAYTFKDNQLTRFSNSFKDLEATRKLIKEISDSIESGKFNRNWGGRFCSTAQGKCEFYNICEKLEAKENSK
ncbi:MAG: ATP-dependent helicase [Promethearchaeota archaeon]